ncbi:MAG: phosphatidylserine decarboxylase, partial [Phycisphaerae bacterium]
MRLAAEGAREMALATFLMAGLASVAVWLFWPAVVVPIAAWAWVVWFFRDPRRVPTLKPGELCSAADGTVTEICDLQHHESIGGAAVRIGVFLSLFDVHINRSPCGGRVRSLSYRRGEFLDARHPESG